MAVNKSYRQTDTDPNVQGYAVTDMNMGPDEHYVPEDGNHDYVLHPGLGWATKLARMISGTPDPQREDDFPTPTMGPYDGRDKENFYGPNDAETARRESITHTMGVGWDIQKDSYTQGPDPRWNPPREERLTSDMSPANYRFDRPWDQLSKGNGARQFNGMHFSMADHRRDYDIGGMDAQQTTRNTYRSSPAPWDADMYDEAEPQTLAQGVVNYVPAPSSSSAYRL